MSANHFGLIISKLVLKNFATFDDQIIKFDTGFNAIIGETGSGKSLILDALQLIMGHRADKKLIRKDCDFSIVEASFKCGDQVIKKYFYDLGFPFDENEIVIKRILYKNGKTKSFLNHQSCSLAILSDFSKRFVDLVGQFENQKLLSDTYQLQLLDNFSLNQVLLSEYQLVYNQITKLNKELLNKEDKAQNLKQREDYLDFQIAELNKLNPSEDKENDLLNKKRILQNIEENRAAILEFNQVFDGDSHSQGLSGQITKLENIISNKLLSEEDINSFFQAKELLNEINYKINSSSDYDFNEEEFEHVINELDQYQKLKRKYSVETEGLIEIFTNFKIEREAIESIDSELAELKENITVLTSQAKVLAKQLHLKRIDNAAKLSKLLSKEVQSLRMNGATIKIQLELAIELTKNGQSSINFIAETNPGEGFYKIKEIASGGELSRILLALRTVLSSKDSISIFLFDEIDSGIGGETAITVGKSLSSVSSNSQVIAITHLPQIANFSDKLILVSKELTKQNNESRTISLIKEVEGKLLKEEVRQMNHLN